MSGSQQCLQMHMGQTLASSPQRASATTGYSLRMSCWTRSRHSWTCAQSRRFSFRAGFGALDFDRLNPSPLRSSLSRPPPPISTSSIRGCSLNPSLLRSSLSRPPPPISTSSIRKWRLNPKLLAQSHSPPVEPVETPAADFDKLNRRVLAQSENYSSEATRYSAVGVCAVKVLERTARGRPALPLVARAVLARPIRLLRR